MRTPTFKLYEQLGVPPGSELAVVKKAWRSAARRLHPDTNPEDPNASERFATLSRAWSILSDPAKKELYDEHGDLAVNMNFDPSLRDLRRSKPRAPKSDYRSRTRRRPPEDPNAFPGAWGGGPDSAEREPQRATGARPRAATPEDRMRSTTASAGAGSAADPSAARPRATPGGHRPPGTGMPKRGADLKFDAIIPLKTAALGGPWVLDVHRPERCEACEGTGWRLAGRACNACQGQGWQTVQANVTIQVPPDTQNNRVITTKGQGAPGLNGGESGDLWTTVKVAPDPHFQRRGLDLWTDVIIPADVAARGGTVDVRNLHEVVTVTVPENSRTGRTIRTKGAGVPGPRGRLPGDLHVRVIVEGQGR